MSMIKKYCLRFLKAGVNGCIQGCATECARSGNELEPPPIPTEFFTSLNPPAHEIEPKTEFLFSGYIGRVDTGSTTMERYCALGNKFIRIKVIDAQEHKLNTDLNYSLMDLASLSSVIIDKTENEYIEYCKLLTYIRIRKMENRRVLKGDYTLIAKFIEQLGETHKDRVSKEYPELVSKEPTVNIQKYKTLYHFFLKKLTPVDVFFNVFHYFLFLYEILGVVSVNNLNTIVCIVNVPDLENAFWTGQYAVFGNGDSIFYPLTSIDVIGHEMSHGLVDGITGLRYRGHSGALNESFADVFGAMFEAYMYNKFIHEPHTDLYGNSDWFIGEDIIKSGETRNLRNMKDPYLSYNPQPKEFGGLYYVEPSSSYDYGGVHINSGIINHCFYLIAESTDANTALFLFFMCMCRLSETSTFSDFSKQLIQCAVDSDKYNVDIIKSALLQVKLYKEKKRPCGVF